MRRTSTAVALAALLLAGCGSVEDDAPPGIDPVADSDASAEDPEDPDGTGDEVDEGDADTQPDGSEGSDVDSEQQDAGDGTDPQVRSAIADAAERTGVDPEAIEVVSFEEVTWPDGSMGCPEPGQMYTQALVEGYRIVLDADGAELTYHGAQGDDPFLCEAPQDPLDIRE